MRTLTHCAQIGPLVGGVMMETMGKTRVMSCSVRPEAAVAVQQQDAVANNSAAVDGANNSADADAGDGAVVRRETADGSAASASASGGDPHSNRKQNHNVSDDCYSSRSKLLLSLLLFLAVLPSG
jgi:hypothetical protein